jgi:hypothetical protein
MVRTVLAHLPGLSTSMLLSISQGLDPSNPLYEPMMQQLQLRLLQTSVELDTLRRRLAAAQTVH